MAKGKEHRVYWRMQGGERRAYGDFRDYADAGGRREALVPVGGTTATTDPDIARRVVVDRLADLEARRRNRAILGVDRIVSLAEFASHHLVEKKRAGRVTDNWLARTERKLAEAIAFFGTNRTLTSIGVRDVQAWTAALRTRKGRGGNMLAGQSVRHYLNALSNLYRRAASESLVMPGYNPVQAMMDKPTARPVEARWLEVHEATLLLEAARPYRPHAERKDYIDCLHPLLATFLLTGGRRSEVLGLEVQDLSFDRKTITFRPNKWRRLKTRTSHRSVPLWPQLEEILRRHIFGGDAPRVAGLLFPSARKPGQPIHDLRKALDVVAERAGWSPGELRTKMFRHTYCAARLQTTDNGAPVSVYTVGRELGHGGEALVKRVYGHLGTVRHRADAVEYRPDIARHMPNREQRKEFVGRLKGIRETAHGK